MSLTEVLEEVTKLSKAEKRQVIEKLLLDEQPAENTAGDGEKQKEMLLRLAAEGVIRLPANFGKPPAPRNFEPVPIKGKPLSETIIEDRG